MTLPASGQLSLGDIATEKGGSLSNVSLTTESTTDINTSSASYPDGAIPHAVSEFYSYDHSASSLTAFRVDETTYGDPGSACSSGAFNTEWYHDGVGAYPTNGDTVYTDSAGTTNPSDGFYWMDNNSVINISSGVVIQSGNC